MADRGRRPLIEPGDSCPVSLALTRETPKNPGEIDLLRGGTPTASWAAREPPSSPRCRREGAPTWIDRPPNGTTRTRRGIDPKPAVSRRPELLPRRRPRRHGAVPGDVPARGPALGRGAGRDRAGGVADRHGAGPDAGRGPDRPDPLEAAGGRGRGGGWSRRAASLLYLVPMLAVVVAAQAAIGAAGGDLPAGDRGPDARPGRPRRRCRGAPGGTRRSTTAATSSPRRSREAPRTSSATGRCSSSSPPWRPPASSAVLMIREGDIDHDLARGADDGDGKGSTRPSASAELFKDRRIAIFVVLGASCSTSPTRRCCRWSARSRATA